MTTVKMELLDFCYDILIRILEELNPADLAACAQASSAFNSFIKNNQRLFKAHYLRNFDDPRQLPFDPEPDWILELQHMVKFQKIMSSEDKNVKTENFKFISSRVDRLVRAGLETNGSSLNKAHLIEMFERPRNLDAVVYRSSLYERGGTDDQRAADNPEDRQLSAKLHCLHGMALGALGRRSLSTHPYARSKVYDLRNYTEKTRWGPFQDDGSMKVDWEMLESLMIILAYNSDTCCPRFMPHFKPVWSDPFGGVIKHVVRPGYPLKLPFQLDIPAHLKDPYNVSGLWHRIVCFLDYNDLYAFNFGPNQPEPGIPREPIKTQEAIRHILMKLEATDVKAPERFDNQDLPITHFTGISRSMDSSWDPNANSKIRGIVRVTPEGEVRWTTVSIFYGGEERWRSEGVQVGGVNSKRGVTGTWFDKDYDPHGPAGPTAFWKMADRSEHHDIDMEDDESSENSEW